MDPAIAEIHKGQEANHAIGSGLFDPNWMVVLAEVYGRNGLIEEGLDTLTEGLGRVARTQERLAELEWGE